MNKYFPKYQGGKGRNLKIKLDLSKLRLLTLYITTQEFNKLMAGNFTARSTLFKQDFLATKADLMILQKIQILMINLKIYIQNLIQIKQNMYWLKTSKASCQKKLN